VAILPTGERSNMAVIVSLFFSSLSGCRIIRSPKLPLIFSPSAGVKLKLLYIRSEAVIPAPYQARGRLSQARNDHQSKATFDAVHSVHLSLMTPALNSGTMFVISI
jgi:hypothetical protein